MTRSVVWVLMVGVLALPGSGIAANPRTTPSAEATATGGLRVAAVDKVEQPSTGVRRGGRLSLPPWNENRRGAFLVGTQMIPGRMQA